MDNFEGSVDVEGIDTDIEETSGDESGENINNESNQDFGTGQNEGDQNEDQDQDDQGQDQGDGTQVTDKGTKLDKNPNSAVHQQLANASREVEEYRRFMTNPAALKNYLKELEAEMGIQDSSGNTNGQNTQEEQFVTDPEKIVTPQDFQSYVKYITKQMNDERAKFQKEVKDNQLKTREKEIVDGISNDINQVWVSYPELRPKNADGTPNPKFDPVLEKEIADMYDYLDKDPRTGQYRGNVSIKQIADRFMKIRRTGETAGTRNAQTTIIDKRSGAIRNNGGSSSEKDDSKLSASQLIAARMAKAMGGRG